MGTGEGRDYFWDIFRSNSLYCAGFIRMVRSFWRLAGWMMVIQPSPYGFLLTSSGASDKPLLTSSTRPEMGLYTSATALTDSPVPRLCILTTSEPTLACTT